MTPERLAEISGMVEVAADKALVEELLKEVERLRENMASKYWDRVRDDNEKLKTRAEAAESRVKELEVERDAARATLEGIIEIHNEQAICAEQFAEVMAENAILETKVRELEFNFLRY